MFDGFYFIAQLPQEPITTLTVIDISHASSYERSDYRTVNDTNYQSCAQAIREARALAAQEGFAYRRFESRYDSSTDEELHVTLCDRATALKQISEALPRLIHPLLVTYFLKITGSLSFPSERDAMIYTITQHLANEGDAILAHYHRLFTGEGITLG